MYINLRNSLAWHSGIHSYGIIIVVISESTHSKGELYSAFALPKWKLNIKIIDVGGKHSKHNIEKPPDKNNKDYPRN